MRRFAPDSLPDSICLILTLVGAIFIALGIVMIVSPQPVLARSGDLDTVVATYPQLDGTALDSCYLCHISTRPNVLNGYGSDYASADLTAIEGFDSDGDGYLNIDEINALTEPGDASDHPHDDVLALSKYPGIAGTPLDSCDLCHSSGTSLNAYGAAYNTNGRNLAAFDLIEAEDSDGDSFINIDEISALTFPGDGGDHPVIENQDMTRALEKYPDIAGTRLDSCSLCHSSGSSLNLYGAAYFSSGRDLVAFDLIEANDSDGDDLTNLEEILQLTFPGDSDDPHDDALALQQYPDLAGTRLDTCTLCHTDGLGSALNSYGTDYRDNGRNLAAFDLIENLDSDEDTYSNIDEIDQLTFPGNASDTPGAEHNYEVLLSQQYPTINGTRLTTPDPCEVCHNTGESTLNAYSSDYASTVPPYDYAAIENIDSDGDGFVNIDEIELFFSPGNSADHPEDMDLMLSVYPTVPDIESRGCHLCHIDESFPDLNSYGADYLSHGRTRAALVAIENLDSDGDGYCNLEELELGYCPGEAECPTHSESLLLQYPYLVGTRLESCDLCHDTSVTEWQLNSYGTDYDNAGGNRGAFAIIETLDSDGDGYLNLAEIEALTMPGDLLDTPAQNNGTNFVFLPIILN